MARKDSSLIPVTMRILSGIQPSGKTHVGNYFSMIKRLLNYQKENELYCFIASYHAMTTVSNRSLLTEYIIEMAIDLLALGIDPERSVFWVQSDVPEVSELTWIISSSITVPQLEIAHSFKDKISRGNTPTAALMYYPVLMAADILIFDSEKVPVGKDQKQHLEIARQICRTFNSKYGETFKLPEADIIADVAIIPGIDGRKMSKSYNNTISIFVPEKKLKKSIMSITTDSTPVDQAKEPVGSALFDIFALFLDEKGREDLADRFRTPGIGYGEIKIELFNVIIEYFASFREKREELIKHKDDVYDILYAGAARARSTARVVLEKARRNSGLIYKILKKE